MNKVIYTWSCEGETSRCYYTTQSKAITAVAKRFGLPQGFGIPEYINTANGPLLNFIEDKLKEANGPATPIKAKEGVYNARQLIKFKEELYKLVRRYNAI